MKRIVTTILGASLLAGAVYAAGNHQMNGMENMNHSNMSKDHVQKCEAFMAKHSVEKSSWTSPQGILSGLYPEGDE